MNPFYLVLNPDNTISFNRPLAHAIGLSETIIYGALVAKWYYYSEREMLDDDGWFYSTVPDLQESTSLSEKQQKRCPHKEIGAAENRPSGLVFRNAVGLVGVVIAHHLPPQILLAGKGLAA